jgi:putative heme-binding domain-containing protein
LIATTIERRADAKKSKLAAPSASKAHSSSRLKSPEKQVIFIQAMLRSLIATGFLFATAVALRAAPVGPVQQPLVIVSNRPLIKMLIPGFTVRELPLHLNNINSLVCAPDGRIFALAYDGNVFQLKDSTGGGLEDTASYFFKNDREQIPASIGMAWGPGGLYIASRGRVLRVRDKGDGTGELETIASGWVPPTIAAGSSLDAVGAAVDKSGNVYFGLGCDAWSSAYRVDTNGHSHYDVHSARGTIQKLSPDFKSRETICTGLRFTVSLAFNAAGDLFATDQEGATWLANGNPFDELLHIEQGRHYGFPPRHPTYLPDVIDEPSVFDYGPQHQSTCGLHFNEPAGGGAKIFGPEWWRGDALIAGESRGKLWRTKLVKTPSGYVAQNELIGCLRMLTIDAIPTPQGDLLVTCHSGDPDWGTGPEGKGKLFRISYTDSSAPQPVFAYAASPTEFRVVFDRPLDLLQFTNLAANAAIDMGKYVTAGNRFEPMHPGYAAVQRQLAVPRYKLPILSAGISADGRAVALRTTPCAEAVNYGITVGCALGEIDVLSDLTGFEAEWKDARGNVKWNGWLPHPDLTVARAFTAASEEHRDLFKLLDSRGTLILRGQLNLWSMLHPAIQPGEKLSYTYPPETVTVIFKSGGKMKLKTTVPQKRVEANEFQITTISKEGQWIPLEITLATSQKSPELDISWFTDEDPRPRAMPLRRVLLPWATPSSDEPPAPAVRKIPEIAGGNWQRGKTIFYGEQPGCFKCHQVGGQGGKIGPDLSNLIYRDYSSVLKDIVEPSAAINPDHLTYNIELTDGGMETGVILSDTPEKLVLGQVSGKSIEIPRTRIVRAKPSAVSLMPEGLLKGLSIQQQRDLLTFLLVTPP